MNRRTLLTLLNLVLALIAGVFRAPAQSTAFTYQGRLEDAGRPANGNYDFRFTLFRTATFIGEVGVSREQPSIFVQDGLFTTLLDYGASLFNGTDYFLEVGVRTNGNTGPFTVLGPRTPLTPTPYAIHSRSAANAATAQAVAPNAVSGAGLQDASISAGKVASGQVVKSLNGLTDHVTLSAGPNVTLTPSGNGLRIAADSGRDWSLTGNVATGSEFLGTINSGPLELRVNNQPVLRLQPTIGTPNLIGGFRGNQAGGGRVGEIVGGTIGGGGETGRTNRVFNDFCTVAGGAGNVAGSFDYLGYASSHATVSGGGMNHAQGQGSFVGGGWQNTNRSDTAMIGGGASNLIDSNSFVGVVAGGVGNRILTNCGWSFIGGGYANQITGPYAAIPGGWQNSAGRFCFAAGRAAKANHDGAFVWSDTSGTDLASSANNQFSVRASGGVRFLSNPGATAGVTLAPGATSWSAISDRDAKKNAQPVDAKEVLAKLAAVPVQRWNYHWEADEATPHLGPMAQDFKAAFFPGRDDKTISTLEFDGVALAAIQGLHEMVKDKDGEIRELKQAVAELKELVAALAR